MRTGTDQLSAKEILAALESAKRYVKKEGMIAKRCILLQISATDTGHTIRWFGSDDDYVITPDDKQENDE